MSYLIADSGSTKTEWCLVSNKKKPVYFNTSGINPYLQSREDILLTLEKEFDKLQLKKLPKSIFFYGAGAASKQNQQILKGILKDFFTVDDIEVAGDMLGAARGVCNQNAGIVCILGTGSASCYYDGEKIKNRQPSLGYIAGDEGSGNHMGKRVLQYYTYETFDTELRMDFELRFGNNLETIIHKLYKEPYPNRYLASFVSLLLDNRGHYMVENIIEDCLNDFFQRSILKYRQSWKKKIYFSGGIAFQFQDVLLNICDQYELTAGNIIKNPMEGLITYHNAQMK